MKREVILSDSKLPLQAVEPKMRVIGEESREHYIDYVNECVSGVSVPYLFEESSPDYRVEEKGKYLKVKICYSLMTNFMVANDLRFEFGIRSESNPLWKFKRIKSIKSGNLFSSTHSVKRPVNEEYEICCGVIDKKENRSMYRIMKFSRVQSMPFLPKSYVASAVTKDHLILRNQEGPPSEADRDRYKTGDYCVAYYVKSENNNKLQYATKGMYGLLTYDELKLIPGFESISFEEYETDVEKFNVWLSQNPVSADTILSNIIEAGHVRTFLSQSNLMSYGEFELMFDDINLPSSLSGVSKSDMMVSLMSLESFCPPDYEQYITFAWVRENWYSIDEMTSHGG